MNGWARDEKQGEKRDTDCRMRGYMVKVRTELGCMIKSDGWDVFGNSN